MSRFDRMRLARELHDLVGHHLTGLSLNLEVASHLTQGKAQEHIQTAQSVTKFLLKDVREVVNSLRGDDSFDLERAIRTLTKDIPKPRIHLDVPEDLGIYDPVRAETILRCVQEIITNAVRHSGAQNLWIESAKTPDGVEIRAETTAEVSSKRPHRDARACRTGRRTFGNRVHAEHGILSESADPNRREFNMIRVCIVEYQTLVRQGFRSLLELTQDMKVVGEAHDGDEALLVIRKANPDVVLLDIQLPKRNGIEVLKALKESNQLPPTLILTTFNDDNLVLEGIRAGARGFLLKDVTLKQLTEAIRTLKEGGTLIKPVITERILRGLEQAKPEFPSLDPPDPLPERETEVLRLMVAGYSNREIAGAVGVSEGTVKNHVSSILSKLGVRDRTRAVLKALELGFI